MRSLGRALTTLVAVLVGLVVLPAQAWARAVPVDPHETAVVAVLPPAPAGPAVYAEPLGSGWVTVLLAVAIVAVLVVVGLVVAPARRTRRMTTVRA